MIRYMLSAWHRRSTSVFVGVITLISVVAAITPLFLTESASALSISPKAPQIVGENFNTHSGDDYHGINVGFRAEGFSDVATITVSLYQDDALLVTNSEDKKLLKLINEDGETRFSTPFVIIGGTYTEEYWQLGSYEWRHDTRPNRAVITISTTDSETPPITQEIIGLSEATAPLSGMLPPPPDTTAPGVAIDAASLAGATPTISGAVDSDAVSVQISLDGGVTWQAAAYVPRETTWSYTVSAPLPNGTYTVLATATDAAGNTTTPPASAEFVVNVPIEEDEDKDEDNETGGRGNGEGDTGTPQPLELTPVDEPPTPPITLFSSSLPREKRPVTTMESAPVEPEDEARVQAISTINTDRSNVEKEIITPAKSNFNWYWILLVLAVLAASYYGYRNWRLNRSKRI